MKKSIIRSSLKTLTSYLTVLLIFAIFMYPLISIAKDNFSKWLGPYSFFCFFILVLIVYGDYKKMAMKEIRPQYKLDPYPLKGFVYGLIGFSPIILIEIISIFIVFEGTDASELMRLKSVALKAILGPLYFILKIGKDSIASYIIASLALPITAMLGYLSGFYNINISITKSIKNLINSFKTKNEN